MIARRGVTEGEVEWKRDSVARCPRDRLPRPLTRRDISESRHHRVADKFSVCGLRRLSACWRTRRRVVTGAVRTLFRAKNRFRNNGYY